MPVVEIGKEPFRNKKFVPSVTIPSTVTKIGDSAFMGSSIQSVNIPDGVTEIGSIAFSGTNLKSIYMPDSVTKIVGDNWGGVFGNCIYLTEVRLSDNLTVIPNQMFKDSKTLYKVNLPKNLKEIGGTAFWNCGNLTELTIPESLTSLKFTGDDSDSNNAFGGCGKLPIKTRQRLQELGYKGKWSF
ncbi:leucine-rich repeat domain-containing protein [Treponema sp. R6D11]